MVTSFFSTFAVTLDLEERFFFQFKVVIISLLLLTLDRMINIQLYLLLKIFF